MNSLVEGMISFLQMFALKKVTLLAGEKVRVTWHLVPTAFPVETKTKYMRRGAH